MANRHDVIIWDDSEYPVEKDYHQAVQQAYVLAGQQAKPSNVMLSFASSLNSRNNDESLEPAVRRYFQHIAKELTFSKTAAFVLPLPDYEPHWRSIMYVLIEETAMYRLVLCDKLQEIILLADNSLLSPRVQTNAPLTNDSENTKDFPITLKLFHQLFKTKADALLYKHGFVFVKESDDAIGFSMEYNKLIQMGKLYLTIGCEGEREFTPSFHFRIIEDNMIAIAQKSDFSYYMAEGGGIFLML